MTYSPLARTESSSTSTRGLNSPFPRKIRQPHIVKELDEVVFGCCCEFVYTGDYSVPSSIYDGIGNESPTEPLRRWDPVRLTWNFFHPESFVLFYVDLREQLGQVNSSYRANDELSTDPKFSFADVFLCHVEVHCIASRAGRTALYYLSLYRLLGLLKHFSLCDA